MQGPWGVIPGGFAPLKERVFLEKLLEELGAYELLNNLLPGAIICVLAQWQTGYQLPAINVVGELCVFYFVGLVVGRLGSLVVEPIYRKLGIISKGAYADFIKASQADPKIDTLSTKNNMYRTFVAVFIITTVYMIVEVFRERATVRLTMVQLVASAALWFLFSYSYHKQSNYIQGRIHQQVSRHR